MPRVGILTFSDGRRYAHEPQIDENKRFEARLRAALEAKGFEVLTGELVWSNALAKSEGEKLARAGFSAARAQQNIGHNPWRMTFVARHALQLS